MSTDDVQYTQVHRGLRLRRHTLMSPAPLPNHDYYRANHGRWRAAFHFRVTDWRALLASQLRVRDRLRVVALAILPRLVGPLVLETTVDYASDGERGLVIHTTRFTKWGLVLYLGVERLTLDPNGRDVSIAREERFPPSRAWRPVPGENRAEVDPSGLRAAYAFELFGAKLVQTGEIVEEGVRIVQTTAWSAADQVLRRY
ncbi:MAG: hypothetical protein ACHREM_17045 [Polyangiales bacterium]